MTHKIYELADQKKLATEAKLNLNKRYRELGVFDSVQNQMLQDSGPNKETRWDISSPDFKPLKDVLGYSKFPFEQNMHKFLSDPEIQHFILSPEMALEVYKLNNVLIDDPESFKQLKPKAKPPYTRCCIEMPLTNEIRKLLDEVDINQEQVRRIGAYIEMKQLEDDSIIYSVQQYHEFDCGAVQASMVTFVNYKDEPIDGLSQLSLAQTGVLWNAGSNELFTKSYKHLGKDKKEIWEKFGGKDAFMLSIFDTIHDLGPLFFGWLFLLNSKSGTITKVVPSRLSGSNLGRRERLRRNRSGYTIIALEDVEYITGDYLVKQKELIAAHRVRGHFKQKKHGIYWWRPHIRGGGELIEREGYKII